MTEEIINQPLDINFILQGLCPRCLQQTITNRKELSRWLGKYKVADYALYICTNDECQARFKVPRRLLSQ